jgi:putative ABC transport system permease protein
MNITLSMREAFSSLTANKLRSSLTILGIVIGVGAVIAMLAIGRGAQSSVTSSIEGIGTNLIFVTSGAAPSKTSTQVRNVEALTLADATALSAAAGSLVSGVAPIMTTQSEVTYSSQTTTTSIYGVTPAYQKVRNADLTEGAFITDTQNSGRLSVAVIGADTASTLFGRTTNLVGQVIRIQGQPFHIIGVLKSKGGSSTTSSDDVVLIPITTAQARLMHRFTRNSVDSIQIQASSAETVDKAVALVTKILAQRHGTTNGTNDFTIRTQAEILSTAQSITGILTIFLGGIAGISLLVGGIGIMNIMLVSVTERTKEIGLRKALGARKRDILLQFLTESILLGFVGGLVGVLLAWGLTAIVQAIAAASSTSITPEIGIDSILLATLFSMAVGLIFGLYPANRAAGLQPVEALRFE